MGPSQRARRTFLKSSALGFGTIAMPWVRAQTSPLIRQEWQQFKTTTLYTPYLRAIGDMKANTNAASRNSWQYWVNVHRNYCPHDVAYFLAWHRGYLFRLEQQFRIITGISSFALPYWDYYTYPRIPSEFLDSATGNPLYVTGRVGTNVSSALSLAPFDDSITNFRRGLSNAFEPAIETQPHNPIHNLIGGRMASMSSPQDPIFLLHHGNIDRLWSAWVRAGEGRVMPPRTHSYWTGIFTYASDLTVPRLYTWDTTTDLGYDYSNTTLPTALPVAQKSQPGLVSVQASATAPAMPPLVNAQRTASGSTGAKTFSVGGVRGLTLDERSVSVQLPLSSAQVEAVQSIAGGGTAMLSGSTLEFRSVRIVLDELALTGKGARGGYFYAMYLNLPTTPDYTAPKEKYMIGTLGPFEVEAGRHHGSHSRRHYPIGDKLVGLASDQIARVTVSFVRVDGEHPPAGDVIDIGEVRLELSAQE